MSSNIVYVGFLSKHRSDCLELLKLKPMDRLVQEFWARQDETVIADLETGWSVILTKDERYIDDQSLLKKLSTNKTI